MALRVLDGNQTATTLSSVVTGGEHIVAHSVVSLGANAISNIASAVSGSVVSISNFPSTQTIAGTVTVSKFDVDAFKGVIAEEAGGVEPVNGVQLGYFDVGAGFKIVNEATPLPISGTVTANTAYSTSVTGTARVGTVTAMPVALVNSGVFGGNILDYNGTNTSLNVSIKRVGQNGLEAGDSTLPVSGAVTARLQDGSGNNLTSTSIGGVQRLNVSLASAATAGGTLPSFINIHGGTDGSVARTMLLDSSGRTVVTVSNFPATQPVSLASTTVTVSSLPSGALTTRFGSVTTANTAQITSAVTNANRKYLLAQNISAGTVTIGIGFSPTTTQGIQLTAGGGLTFDTFCPTGAVYWLGAVTGAAFTILEG